MKRITSSVDTTARGEKVGTSKLKEGEVLEIRALRRAGRTLEALADGFGVSVRTVYCILSGRTWAHLKG